MAEGRGLCQSRARDDHGSHPATAHLATATAAEIAADLAAGRTTSVALVRALLERIEAVDRPGDTHLNSVLALAPDALATAERLDAERAAGTVRGPLHGVPVLIKDNIEAIGLPGTAGSLALAGRLVIATHRSSPGCATPGSWSSAPRTSPSGPTSAPLSTSGWSGAGGLTGNPWGLDRSAGGSSSGSGAAVAGGLAPLAIGTETDGSITCPSSLNGIVGLKPTLGLVPTAGIVPISGSQDMPGPMARSVHDAALLLDALTGSDEYAAACGTATPAGLRLGVAAGWLTGHPGTDAVFLGVTDSLFTAGVTLVTSEVTASNFLGIDELTVLLSELLDDMDAYLAGRPGDGVRSLADVVEFNQVNAHDELAHFGQEFFEMALETGGRAGEGYDGARARCLEWAVDQNLQAAFDAEDAPEFLVAPGYWPAWKSDLVTGDHFGGGNASPAPSIAGWPVICLPMGVVGGLPWAWCSSAARTRRPGSSRRPTPSRR